MSQTKMAQWKRMDTMPQHTNLNKLTFIMCIHAQQLSTTATELVMRQLPPSLVISCSPNCADDPTAPVSQLS